MGRCLFAVGSDFAERVAALDHKEIPPRLLDTLDLSETARKTRNQSEITIARTAQRW
jgi:hypothetical protein